MVEREVITMSAAANVDPARATQANPAPTLGRIVAYNHPKMHGKEAFMCPGIVEGVSFGGPSGSCNLTLFVHGGTSYVANVMQGTGEGQWSFPARAGD
jgi:hypothetical protein